MAADPRWSEKVVTPQSFGTPEAAQGRAPAGDARFGERVQPGAVSWATLTGQNMEGTTNAFDTTFWAKATEQDEEQRSLGMGSRWTRPDATGVVVYNDEKRGLRFGDVYLNGTKQGNLREGYAGVDQQQGNEMLARMVLPREVWAKAYETEAGKPLTFAGNLDEEIGKVEKANTENYAKGITASEFEAGVKERAAGFEEDPNAQFSNLVLGAAGGALTGGGAGLIAGTVFPGVGNVAGAVGGAIVGALTGAAGAYTNRDERFTELSQAMEQHELATRDGHRSVGIMDAVSGYAGFTSGALNPTRNLLHGLYDGAVGEQGDSVSSYYNTEGGLGMTVLDTAALLVDGIGSFGSGPARLAYTGIMGVASFGSMGSVVTGTAAGNVAFNPYSGTYEDIGAGGMAQLGVSAMIDVAQTGAARGVGRFGGNMNPLRAQTVDVAGGFRIGTAADGAKVTRGLGLSALIPSEAAVGLSARMLARRSLNAQSKELSRENLARETARHIDNLTTGRKTIATAVVNGFGEGAEEVVQAALGATAFGETPTFRDLFEAARQGFGMGVGMGTAIGVNSRSTADKYRARSEALRVMRQQEPLTDEQWKGMTLDEMAREGTATDPREEAMYQLASNHMARQGMRVTAANIPELRRIVEVVRQTVEQEMRNSQDAVEVSRMQVRSNYDWGPQDYVVSLGAAIRDLTMREAYLRKVSEGVAGANPDLTLTVDERALALTNADGDAALLNTLLGAREALANTADPASRARLVQAVNEHLRGRWHGTDSGERRSATVWGARYPLNAAGSFQLLRLQISPELTEAGNDMTVFTPDELLAPTGGDYDGDRFINLVRQLLPDDSYAELRRGAGQLTSEGTMLAAKPYVEEAVELLYDAMARPGTAEFDTAVEARRRLRGRLHGITRRADIPADIRRRLVSELVEGLSDRQPGALGKFLNKLSTEHAPAMRKLADELDGSPWLMLNRAIEDELRIFQTARALSVGTASAGGAVVLPAVSTSMPRWFTRAVRHSSALLQGAAEAGKFDIFRLQTVLKYNSRREATETQEQERTGALAELVRVFVLLNDGLGLPGEQAIHASTRVQDLTISWLKALAREHQQAMGTHSLMESVVLLAGAQVPDLDDAISRRPRSDGQVTLLQSIMHEVIQGERRTYDTAMSDSMASRLSSLDALTTPDYADATGGRHAAGGNALVEVFGATPIFDLLGDQGAAINTFTVRGLRDLLMSLRGDVRRQYEERLRQHPSYAEERDAAEGVNPYSPYRILVDSIVQSAHQQLTEKDGLAHGVLARSSNAATKSFGDLHDSLRKLANARGRALKTAADARALLSEDAALASRVLAVVEARGVRAGTVRRDADTGEISAVAFPQWIYEVLAEPVTARAEMQLLRETLRSINAGLGTNGTEEIDSHKVNDRIVRLWLDLTYRANDATNRFASQDTAALLDFERALADPTGTVESFMRTLNTDHRFRPERSAPYMPWNRDRSVVEANRYGAGVSEVMEGTEMRDALRDAAASAAVELRNTEAMSTYLERNAELLDTLREARDNPRSVNRGAWKNFEAWVDLARNLPTMIGASLWVQQAEHINEIVGHMGVKGISPDNVAALGKALAAQLPTFDMAFGQLISSSTSGSMGDVLTDMTQLARSNRTIVLNDGTVVDWTATSATEALDLLSSPATAGLASRMLGMTAWDYNDETGANSLISIVGEGVAGFAADPAESLFAGGTGASSAKLRRLMILESMATDRGGKPIIPVYLAQQMNIREAAIGHVIDPNSAERRTIALEILSDLADALQAVSTMEGLYVKDERGTTSRMTPVEDDADPEGDIPAGTGADTTLLHRTLLRAGRSARRAKGVGNSVAGLLPPSGPLRDVGHELLRVWSAKFSASAAASGSPGLLAVAQRFAKDLNRVDDYASPLDILVDTYKDFSDPTVQRLLVQHAAAHGDIMRAVPWAAAAIGRALDPNTVRKVIPYAPGDMIDLPDLTNEQWETVARGVIAFTMHTTYGITTDSELEVSVFPSLSKPNDLRDQLPFWDPTFVAPGLDMFVPNVLTDVSAPVSPLLAAQLELVQKMGQGLPTTTPYVAQQAVSKFITPQRTDPNTGRRSGSTGRWHALLPALMHSAIGAVMASATESAISMAGLNPSRLRLLMATTKQNWAERPPDTELSTAVVPVDQLVQSVAKADTLDSRIDITLAGGATVSRALAQLDGRVVRQLTLTLPDGTERPLLGDARYATGLMLPDSAGVLAGEAGVLSLTTAQAAISNALLDAGVPRANWGQASLSVSFFHPETKAASASRAADQAYSHNPWFDGVIARTDAAFSQGSLLGSLFFGLDGIVPGAYDASLGAIKKLTFALQQITLMPEAARRAYAAQGTTDMAGMLHALTTFALKQKVDGKPMSAGKYNAIYKLFSLLYVVRVVDPATGQPAVLSAEQVIARQAAGEAFAPDSLAEVVGLPLQHVLALMGERDLADLVVVPTGDLDHSPDVSRAKAYTKFPVGAWNTGMFPGFVRLNETGDAWHTESLLDQSALRNVSLPKSRVMAQAGRSEIGSRDFYSGFRKVQETVLAMRSRVADASTRWATQVETVQRRTLLRQNIGQQVLAAVQVAGTGSPAAAASMLGPNRTLVQPNSASTAWEYVHRGARSGSAVEGVLHHDTSDGQTSEFTPVLGDTVFIKASVFLQPGDPRTAEEMFPEAREALVRLTGAGASIALPADPYAGELRGRLVRHLREMGYVPTEEGGDTFEPAPTESRSRATAAFESSLRGATKRTSQNRVLMSLSADNHVNENSIISVNGGLGGLEDYMVREVVQTARYAEYAPVQDPGAREDVIAALLPVLESADGLNYLADQGELGQLTGREEEEALASFDDAITTLRDRLRAAQADPSLSLLPEAGSDFGTGDFIPLASYNADGQLVAIHLYRHGHEPVREKLLLGELPPGNAALGVRGARLTIDRVTVDSEHTTHRGVLVQRSWSGLAGFNATIRIKLSDLGSKVFETMTGMKWTTTPATAEQAQLVPTHGVFAGRPLLGMGDLASPTAKTSDGWWLNTPGHIVESVGFDAMPYLVRVLAQTEFDQASPELYATAEAAVLERLHAFVREHGSSVDPATVVARRTDGLEATLINELQARLSELVIGDQDLSFDEPANVTQAEDLGFLRLVLTALAAGAPLTEALSAPGYLTGADTSHTMHPVFTTLLHQLPLTHPTRVAFIDQINGRMPVGPNGVDGWTLNPDFTWTRRVQRGTEVYEVQDMLAFAEVRNTDHNDSLQEQGIERKKRGSVSATTSAMAYTTWDVTSLMSKPNGGLAETLSENKFLHGDTGLRGLSFGRALKDAPSGPRRDDDLPLNQAEVEHVFTEALPARRALSVPIDQTRWYEGHGKERVEAAKRQYQDLFDETLRALHLQPTQATFLTEMIRSVQGRPAGVTNREAGEFLTHREAVAALRLILANAKRGDLPTKGGAVSTVSRSALRAMHDQGYPLNDGTGKARPEGAWSEWVDVVLAETFSADPQMRGYVAVSNMVDGLLYEYRSDVKGLPASTSSERQAILQIASTRSGLLVASPHKRNELDRPSMVDGAPVHRAADMTQGDWMIEELPQGARAMVEQRMASWEKRNGLGSKRRQSPRSEAIRGAQVRADLADTNVVMRFAQLGYVLKSLVNPGLWVSAFLELAVRGGQERVVSLLAGETAGQQGFTAEQRAQWRTTVSALAANGSFYEMVYGNTNFQQANATTSLEKRLQRMTTFASASFNDPTWGVRANTIANRFMEAAWDSVQKMSGERHISIEQFLDTLAANPESLAMISADAVQYGYRRVEYARGLQDNLLERTRRTFVEGIISRGGPGTNSLGVLLLRFPTMFFRFRSNTIINMLGLQAPHAILSSVLSDRTKRPGGLKDALTGENADLDPSITDQARIEDAMDLSRAIIRSGVSHTQLFLGGALISAAGFGGEDDEEKLLNKLRRYQTEPVAQDPLSLENDFRNAEAWFADMLPAGMAMPPWVAKMFVSPLMGMARFQDTGDFRQVLWGVMDALGSMPLLNTDSILNSWEMANSLADAAAAESMSENVEHVSQAQKLLLTSIGTLENMLFESAFASMIYQGADDWDRDPYARPEMVNGVIVRDQAYQEPQPTTALSDFVDPITGEIRSGYVANTGVDAQLRTMAENRPMLAAVLSLIKQDSTYWRYNMVPKIREVNSEALDADEAMDLAVSILDNQTGKEIATALGAEGVVRGVHLGTLHLDSPALKNFSMTKEVREEVQTRFLSELTEKYIEAGYSAKESLANAKVDFYGQGFNEPDALGLQEILWGDAIPYSAKQEYMQLNTTYVMGPNGRPIATGIDRSALQAFGIVLDTFHDGSGPELGVDQLLNSVDDVRSVNLGMRGLVRMDESWNTPTPEEIGKSITDALEAIEGKIDGLSDILGNEPFQYGSGWRNYGRRGYSRGGYGSGGYGSSYVADWGGDDQRLNTPRRIDTPYADDLYSINTSSPIIRRASIRRERFSSERGRLNQWQ